MDPFSKENQRDSLVLGNFQEISGGRKKDGSELTDETSCEEAAEVRRISLPEPKRASGPRMCQYEEGQGKDVKLNTGELIKCLYRKLRQLAPLPTSIYLG